MRTIPRILQLSKCFRHQGSPAYQKLNGAVFRGRDLRNIHTNATTMRALYLRPRNKDPSRGAVSTLTEPPTPAELVYSDEFPRLKLPAAGERDGPCYLIKVLTTSPTRGELAWPEELDTEPSKRADFGPVPCHDIVGRVVAVSDGYTSSADVQGTSQFRVGDKVWGLIDFDRDGAAAEEVIALDGEIVQVPVRTDGIEDELNWEEMLATVPLAGLTAWQALFEHGGLKEPGLRFEAGDISNDKPSQTQATSPKKVLISGASGSVGLLAIQIARAASSSIQPVHVTAISSPRGLGAASMLRADVVVTSDNVSQTVTTYGPFDLVFDLTGGSLREKILSTHASSSDKASSPSSLMTPSGKFVSITAPLSDSESEDKDLASRYTFFIVKPNAEQLGKIGNLVQAGQLKGFVHDEVFSLDRGEDALAECEKRGRKGLGKVVLRVSTS